MQGVRARLIDAYDAALFDLDGVLYVGPHAVPGAAAAVTEARRRGVRVAYLTNNASRPPADVAAHLAELGIGDPADTVVTSAQVGARLVARTVGPGARVLAIGGPGVAAALTAEGIEPVASAADAPAAVLQGYGPDVGWRELTEAVFAVRAGVPWVATNTDRTIPTPRGIGPGNGLLVGVVRAVTGVEPQVAGKPYPEMVAAAVDVTGASRPLIIGDRLDTDIAAAGAYGCDSLLVLTGVTSAYDLLRAAPGERPTFVGADASALLAPGLAAQDSAPGTVTCGGWRVALAGGAIEVTGGGVDVAGLTALAAVCWAHPELPDDAIRRALAAVGYGT